MLTRLNQVMKLKETSSATIRQRTKLGGNGPIMANALAGLGVKVTYVGALGYPTLHPVFNDFAQHADVHSIAEAPEPHSAAEPKEHEEEPVE